MPYVHKNDPDAAAAIKEQWPIGTPVKLNEDASVTFPLLRGLAGKVEAHARNGNPKVLFEGRKTSVAWNPSLLRKVRKTTSTPSPAERS